MFSLLFEQGDYGAYMEHLADSHEMQAREYAKRGNKEKCLYHLEQAFTNAVGFKVLIDILSGYAAENDY